MSATARRCVLFGLVLAVVVIFWPATGHQFVFDDFQYVVTNPDVQKGFSPETVRWAFTSRYASNWHPVTWLSHMLDVQLFGLATAEPHLINILLHGVNTALLFLVLTQLTNAPWRSAFVAALFAAHPLHVETVAWVAERKDLLAALFLLLALAAYRRYVEQPGTVRYLAVVAFFCLGIMAKPMVVTLPLLLLLLDFWPLDRRSRGVPLRRLLLEKLPLVALSALSAAMTIVAQREGGALRSVHQYPLAARAGNALVSYLAYIAKTLNPSGLTAFYPHPGTDLPLWKAAGAGLLLAILTWAAVRHMRSRPWLTAGWLWYLLTLVPVIGLVQVGDQGLADRYTYLPLIGLFIIISWGAEDLTLGRPRLRQFAPAAAASVLILLAGASRVQVAWWKDNDTLFRRALAVTTNNWFAHISLGAVLGMQGDLDGGAAQYREALRIRPQDPILQNNLGFILGRQGKIEEALARFREAALLREDYAEPLFNAGVLYLKINDLDSASRQCEALDRVDRRWADRLREFLRYKQGLISVKPQELPFAPTDGYRNGDSR